jgi:hypothetical protein
VTGEGEGPVADPGGESVESQFPLHIVEAGAIYGMLYAHVPKGGYDAILQNSVDIQERMEIRHEVGRETEGHAAVLAGLMEDMRQWLVEQMSEAAVADTEKRIDAVRERYEL